MTRQQLQAALQLKDDEHFRKAYLLPALEAGVIEMTVPYKPRSKQIFPLTRQKKGGIFLTRKRLLICLMRYLTVFYGA